MNDDRPTWDLIQRPWIPVMEGGVARDICLRQVLLEAHKVQALVPSPATMIPALLRQVLLPVLIDALGVPRSASEWGDRWRHGRFDEETIVSYFDAHGSRFDLFDPVAPFAQVAGLRAVNGEEKSAAALVPAFPTGNNVPLHNPRTDAMPVALTPGAAARYLVHLLCWDTAAIKSGAAGDPQVKGGKTTGNAVGTLGMLGIVIPVGRTLFETLMLNVPIIEDGLADGDRPQWRAEPPGPSWSTRPATGLLDRLTWPSRRVRLIPEADDEGVQVCSVVITAGDRLSTPPIEPLEEPHTLWRVIKDPKPDEPPRRPRRHSSGHAAWQGLDALLALPQPGSPAKPFESSRLLMQIGALRAEDEIDHAYPLGIELAGYEYGNQMAVYENMVEDSLPLPIAALRVHSPVWELLTDVAGQAAELVQAVDLLDADLRRASGGDPTPWDKGQRPGSLLAHDLDAIVRRLLAGLQRQPGQVEPARHAWRDTARQITFEHGDRLLDSVPPVAFSGRQDGNRTFRASDAERWFRIRLAKALPADDLPNDTTVDPAEENV